VLGTVLVTPADDGTVGAEIAVGSPAWYAWLEEAHSFAYRGVAGRFTARTERHGARGWRWQAYQRRDGKLHSAYLGHSPDLTAAHLGAIAATLARRGVAAPPTPPAFVSSPFSPGLTVIDLGSFTAVANNPVLGPAMGLALVPPNGTQAVVTDGSSNIIM
jgi:hypothetical protein